MNITLYSFEKKLNSTANPVDAEISGIETVCRFKDATSIENPIIELNSFGEIDITSCNYCYIDDIDKYYWIDDIVLVTAKIAELHCSLDPLATYKDEILDQSAYVLYSASRYDKYLPDLRIPLSNHTSTDDHSLPTVFTQSGYSVIFATIGGEETESQGEHFYNGGYNFYICSEQDWNNVLAKMCNADGIWDDIKNYFNDVPDSFIFARRIPVAINSIVNPISIKEYPKFAKTELEYPVYRLPAQYLHPDPITLIVPQFQDNFTDWEPYSKLQLYFPFLGTIDLATNEFVNTVKIDYVLDLLTGLMTVNICRTTTSKIIASYTTEFGESIPVVTNQTSIGSAISSGIGAAGWGMGAIAGGSAVMGITAVMMASSALTSAVTTTTKQHGSFGGTKAEQLDIHARLLKTMRTHEMPINELNTLYGRPLGRVVKLSTLTGYCQTRDYKYKGTAPKNVIETIEQLVDGGIYIE